MEFKALDPLQVMRDVDALAPGRATVVFDEERQATPSIAPRSDGGRELSEPPHIVMRIVGHAMLDVTMGSYAHATLEEQP